MGVFARSGTPRTGLSGQDGAATLEPMTQNGVMKRAVGLAVTVALALSLASPRMLNLPFTVRTGLPLLGEGQYYVLLDGGYAFRASVNQDAVSIVDLRSGVVVWRLESAGSLQVHDAVAGTVVVSARPYSDRENRIMSGPSTISGYDLATGRRLWSRDGDYLGHRAGSIVPVNDNEGGVGLDARTGEVVWRTPSLRPSNLEDAGKHWQVTPDGTVEIVDLLTGQAAVRGKVPAGSWIIGWDDRIVLMESQPTYPKAGGTALPGTATLFDRTSLAPIATLPIKHPMTWPQELWLCDTLVCSRGGVDLTVFDRGASVRWTRTQFLMNAVIRQPGGRTLIYGTQSRDGTVPAGKRTNDRNQLLDAQNGDVVADFEQWRLIHVEAGRIWVGLFASRETSPLIQGWSVKSPAYLGFVDLRPGSPLTVQGVTPLDGPFEDCDMRDGWLLCQEQDRDRRPVALLLRA